MGAVHHMNCTMDLVTRLYGSFSAELGIGRSKLEIFVPESVCSTGGNEGHKACCWSTSKNNPGKLIFMEER